MGLDGSARPSESAGSQAPMMRDPETEAGRMGNFAMADVEMARSRGGDREVGDDGIQVTKEIWQHESKI